ncbi:MAG: DUF664 domain-containing protein [Gemmatimonadaceae bacterium]
MMNAQLEFRNNIARVMLRDLAAMRREVEQYPDDETLWKAVPGLTNAGGNLVLHVAGNINHFVGKVLGESNFVRNRDAEFMKRGLTRAQVVKEIDHTLSEVTRTFSTLNASKLAGIFPQDVNGNQIPTDTFLMHLVSHLGYHLGQVDYHRRCATGDATTIGTMSLPALLLEFPPMHHESGNMKLPVL